MRTFPAIFLTIGIATQVLGAPPTTAPVKGLLRVNGALVRPSMACRWGDLLHIELKSGELCVDASPAEQNRARLNGRRVVATIDESPDPWIITAELYSGTMNRDRGWAISAVASHTNPDDAYHLFQITSTRTSFNLMGEGRVNGRAMKVQFSQAAQDQVQLILIERLADGANKPVILRSSNVSALLATNPREVRVYLLPLLNAVAGRRLLQPGATDVYRVFISIRPDPNALTEVEKILPELAAPDAARRDAASARLEQVGAPAALALLRMDRTTLSPEQKSRTDRFLAAHSINVDPNDARRDPFFLADCLLDDDRRVRVAAKESLAALTAQPVEFDLDQDPTSRAATSERMIEQLLRPATQH